jgi:hypothetical protein
VTDVAPNQGTALGGTALTVSGSGLSAVDSVVINGVPCLNVVAVSDVQVTCVTAPRAASPQFSLEVSSVGGRAQLAYRPTPWYRYLDRWSAPSTWLNNEPPVDGDFVVVPYGQAVVRGVGAVWLRKMTGWGGGDWVVVAPWRGYFVGPWALPRSGAVAVQGSPVSVEATLSGAWLCVRVRCWTWTRRCSPFFWCKGCWCLTPPWPTWPWTRSTSLCLGARWRWARDRHPSSTRPPLHCTVRGAGRALLSTASGITPNSSSRP